MAKSQLDSWAIEASEELSICDVLIIDALPVMHMVLREIVRSVLRDATVHCAKDLEAGFDLAVRGVQLGLTILDLGLPGYSGIGALLRYRERMPNVRLVVISEDDQSSTARAALRMGAAGYIPKSFHPSLMTAAIHVVSTGGIYIPPQVLSSSMIRVEDGRQRRRNGNGCDLPLTKRQTEVLRLIAKGYYNSDIATELKIAQSTVKQHIYAVYNALGVSSRTQAMVQASQRGFDLR